MEFVNSASCTSQSQDPSLPPQCLLQEPSAERCFGKLAPSLWALWGGCRSVGINTTKKSFSVAGWPGEVSGTHRITNSSLSRRGSRGTHSWHVAGLPAQNAPSAAAPGALHCHWWARPPPKIQPHPTASEQAPCQPVVSGSPLGSGIKLQ